MTETTTAPASVADTLRAAKALIDTLEKWRKGAMARRTKRGRSLNADDPDAALFCMVGAVSRVDGPYEMGAYMALTKAIRPERNSLFTSNIVEFNDARRRTHAE